MKTEKDFKERINRIKKCCGYPKLKKEQDEYCPFCYGDIQYIKGVQETIKRVLETIDKLIEKKMSRFKEHQCGYEFQKTECIGLKELKKEVK